MTKFVVGLDLGQAQDYTALAVVERTEGGERHVRHLERFPLGTTYPAIVERVAALLSREPLAGDAELVVDATGVGAPVVDLLRDAGLRPVAVTITGGEKVIRGSDGWRVPKRDLVAALQVALQTGRLKVAATLPLAEILTRELLDFRVRITDAAHDTYGAWREGSHDDLVLAVALAVWWAENIPQPPAIAVVEDRDPAAHLGRRIRRVEHWQFPTPGIERT